jgi:hypothetical protein
VCAAHVHRPATSHFLNDVITLKSPFAISMSGSTFKDGRTEPHEENMRVMIISDDDVVERQLITVSYSGRKEKIIGS